MTIHFHTPGNLDLSAAFIFGLSAKETKNPIGYFGTGLKYAIAVLLQTGHEISISKTNPDSTHNITKEPRFFRGQDFNEVRLDGARLNFTTELGKNWEVWMAYRELASNTIDEGGSILQDNPPSTTTSPTTTISVTGAEIEKAFLSHNEIFLSTLPVAITSAPIADLELHSNPTRSNIMYYKGVRVGKWSAPTTFTYNFTRCESKLTEDRQLFPNSFELADPLSQLTDEKILREILCSPSGTKEHDICYYDHPRPSQQFLETALSLKNVMGVNKSAVRIAEALLDSPPETISMTDLQTKRLTIVLAALTKMGLPITYPIRLVALPPGYLGQAKNGEILISPKAFEMGNKQLAMTLLEENIHLATGASDFSRGFQDALLEKIISIGEEKTGEPL